MEPMVRRRIEVGSVAARSFAAAGRRVAAAWIAAAAIAGTAGPLAAQTTTSPLPSSIESVEGIIVADVVEFATLPDVDGEAARDRKSVV